MPGGSLEIPEILSFVAGCLFLMIVGIIVRRFWQSRLWMMLLRGLTFVLFSIICWTWVLGFHAPNSEIARGWYQYLILAFLGTEFLNLTYLSFVIFGHAHEEIGACALFLVGVNISMSFFPENLSVVLMEDLQVYYMVLSPVFIGINLILGIFHVFLNARANLRIIRRPDVVAKNKIKFFIFTTGISIVYFGFVAVILGAIMLQDGTVYPWLTLACVLGLICTFYGLLYANSSVFQIPIRVHLLVLFGPSGEIHYEKWFSKNTSQSAALLPPAAASIAGLVDTAFCQTRQMHSLSLQKRQILYEWRENVGAMLITEHDSGIFRNSLRKLLLHASLLPNKRDEFDNWVTRVFNYYPIEK